MKVVHLIVRGEVQGVGYRAFVELEAELHKLHGWVRNRSDGSVEAVLAGEAGMVDQVIDCCREGPANAEVTSVEVREADPEMLSLRSAGRIFEVLPTK